MKIYSKLWYIFYVEVDLWFMLNNNLIVFSSVRYLLMEVLLIKVNNVFVNLLLRGLMM